MTHPSDPRDPARRRLLGRIVAGLATMAAALPATPARAATKRSKSSVAYRDAPRGARRCDNCVQFQPPAGCRTVEGPVSAQGWCSIWKLKKLS